MRSGQRLVGTLILLDGAAFALFFAAAVYGYSANDVVPHLSIRWEVAGALLSFFRWLPALQFLAVAVALGSSEGESGELVGGSMVPAAVLSALLAAAALAAGPPLQAFRGEALRASASFNTSLAQARLALDGRDLDKAEAALATARAVSPGDQRLDALADTLGAARARQADKIPAGGPTPPPLPTGASGARAYYLNALALVQKGQNLEAYRLASAAAQIDPTYVDAQRLAATIWERLSARGGDQADKERADFYARKLNGYGMLLSKNPISAYALFLELSATHGSDPDVRRYLAEALTAVKASAFFKSEIDSAFAGYVLGPVFLRIPSSDGSLHFIAARDAAWSENALYFREVEYLETGKLIAGGELRAQGSASFGKVAGGKLFLTCVDRDRPSTTYQPRWAPGPVGGIASVVDLPLSPDAAYRVIAAEVSPESLTLPAAWRAATEAPLYGVDPRPLISELLRRSSLPFGVFTAAALGLFAGVRFRRRKGGFSRGYYLLVPLMALALLPALVLAGRADQLISLWSQRIIPGLGALGIAAGARALLLLLAVLLMAGARHDQRTRYRTS